MPFFINEINVLCKIPYWGALGNSGTLILRGHFPSVSSPGPPLRGWGWGDGCQHLSAPACRGRWAEVGARAVGGLSAEGIPRAEGAQPWGAEASGGRPGPGAGPGSREVSSALKGWAVLWGGGSREERVSCPSNQGTLLREAATALRGRALGWSCSAGPLGLSGSWAVVAGWPLQGTGWGHEWTPAVQGWWRGCTHIFPSVVFLSICEPTPKSGWVSAVMRELPACPFGPGQPVQSQAIWRDPFWRRHQRQLEGGVLLCSQLCEAGAGRGAVKAAPFASACEVGSSCVVKAWPFLSMEVLQSAWWIKWLGLLQ